MSTFKKGTLFCKTTQLLLSSFFFINHFVRYLRKIKFYNLLKYFGGSINVDYITELFSMIDF